MSTMIGITGAIGSGKTTFTTMLRKLEPSHAVYESGEVIAEVADDFNRALSGELAFETTNDPVELVNQSLIWLVESINDKLHQDVNWTQLALTKQHMASRPELFEKLFLYVKIAQGDPQILEARITRDNKSTYRPLLQWLGGYLVAKVSPTIWYDEIFRRIDLHDSDKSLILINGLRYPDDAAAVRERDGVIVCIDRTLEGIVDTTDPTEAQRSHIEPDIVVRNNGGLRQLEATAEKLWQDLSIATYSETYSAIAS